MPNRLKLTEQVRARFIARLSETANVTASAQAIAVSRVAVYEHREKDPEFRALWDEAVNMAIDRLEAEAWRRGLEGWDEPVFQGGAQCGIIHRYSDRLLEILLRAKRPAEYRERMEHTGPGGGPVQHEHLVTFYLPENPRIVTPLVIDVTPQIGDGNGEPPTEDPRDEADGAHR